MRCLFKVACTFKSGLENWKLSMMPSRSKDWNMTWFSLEQQICCWDFFLFSSFAALVKCRENYNNNENDDFSTFHRMKLILSRKTKDCLFTYNIAVCIYSHLIPFLQEVCRKSGNQFLLFNYNRNSRNHSSWHQISYDSGFLFLSFIQDDDDSL